VHVCVLSCMHGKRVSLRHIYIYIFVTRFVAKTSVFYMSNLIADKLEAVYTIKSKIARLSLALYYIHLYYEYLYQTVQIETCGPHSFIELKGMWSIGFITRVRAYRISFFYQKFK
jgi:hypothetical protein